MLKDLQITVPCGKCPPCRSRRTQGWGIRMLYEQKVSQTSFMLTLTYNSDNVPITNHGYKSLDKTHIQLFLKRLRKHTQINNYGYDKIRYYACGEYGSQSARPHYHLLIYNSHPDNIVRAWKKDGNEIGTIHLAPLNPATINYAFKYLQKASTVGRHPRDDRQKEFQLFSKGLGQSYLSEAMIEWHKADIVNRIYCPIEDGKKVAMPRYYKDKIFKTYDDSGFNNELEPIKNAIKIQMQGKAQETWDSLVKDYGDTLQDILHERRVHAFAQMHKKSSQKEKL